MTFHIREETGDVRSWRTLCGRSAVLRHGGVLSVSPQHSRSADCRLCIEAMRKREEQQRTSAALQVVDPVVRPRHENGIDWGAERYVLARSRSREVWWRPGRKYWSSVMEPSAYAPTELVLVDMSLAYPYGEVQLAEGGRLTSTLLEKHRAQIDAWLKLPEGLSATGRIDPKRRWTIDVI